MANEKTMNSRIQHKIDTSVNWAKATGFIPKKGELIIYSDVNRMKVGDGVTNVNNLSFTDQELRDEIASFNYDSLSQAIADINNSVKDNAITDISAAKVKVFTAHTGAITVMLLDDVSESAQINISKDIDLVLNGKTLSFTTAAACLNFTTGTSCTINGDIAGSKISKENVTSTTTASINLFTVYGDNLIINGGEYNNSGSIAGYCQIFRLYSTNKIFEINGCSLNASNTSTGIAIALVTEAEKTIVKNSTLTVEGAKNTITVQIAGKEVIIEDSVLTTTADAVAQGLQAYANTSVSIYNSSISAIAGTTCYGIYGAGELIIEKSNISANGGTSSSSILNTGTATIKNSKILGDAPGDNANEENSSGISNLGMLTCDNTDVTGTLSGISNAGQLYVNGGVLSGYSHGGIYFAHGVDGIAYVNDATLRCGYYEGVYTDVFEGDTVAPYASFYVGGGSNENNSNITVYLDGCIIDNTYGQAFVMRGTSGETNNTVNISNTALTGIYGGSIRIDNNTHQVNVGIGTSFTDSSFSLTDDTIVLSDVVEYTNELYRKKHPDAVCNGKDFATLYTYLSSIPNGDEVSY